MPSHHRCALVGCAIDRTYSIPGAHTISYQKINSFSLDVSVDQEVIVYCACPNETSAAMVSEQLMFKGYKKVRPLSGVIDASIADG